MFVGIHSQCIYRVIQGFMTHVMDPWYFLVHGIYPWFLTHSHFKVFFVKKEWGYVTINAQHQCFNGRMNNNDFNHFLWNLIIKVKTNGIIMDL